MSSFFFQAEDGIRDPLVTGVQTCALPISCVAVWGLKPAWATRPPAFSCQAGLARPSVNGKPRDAARPSPAGAGAWSVQEIGRASCRERGRGGEGDGTGESRR